MESEADPSRNLVGTYDPVPGETAYGLPVYKKRGEERWMQCCASLMKWIVQTKDCQHTTSGISHSLFFSNIYECKLPHEMTGQWSTLSNNNWIKIDVKITVLPSPSTRPSTSSGSAVFVSPR